MALANLRKTNFKALCPLDRKLRPSGPSAKSPAVFSAYEVNAVSIALYI